MTTNLYQVRDNVAEAVMGPILTAKIDAAAIRIFHTAMADEKGGLSQHPQDYDLLYLGFQTEESGQIHALPEPKVIATGRAWIEQHNAQRQQSLPLFPENR